MISSTVFHPLFDILDDLVDSKVGIIRHLSEFPREAGAPDFFHFYAESCDTRAFSSQKNFERTGGASSDRRIALAKAAGEAIERYCAALFQQEEFPLFAFESAPFSCVSPPEFALNNSAQLASLKFPYVPFTTRTSVRWVEAIDPSNLQACHVPAGMVYIPYYYDRQKGEFPIAQSISTGLACHSSFEEAAISAICEVVERDAFMITWQAQLGMPQIRLESLTQTNADLIRRFQKTGSSVFLFNLTLEHGIPTILAVLCSEAQDLPALVFAASSHLSPEQAVRKSLEELAHTRRLAQDLKFSLPSINSCLDQEEAIISQAQHVRFYCDQEHIKLVDFLFSSTTMIDFGSITNHSQQEPPQNLQTLVNLIKRVNHRVLLVDVTSPDVKELGLWVLRAIIPGFHPLVMGHRLRALGGSRLWTIPQQLGYRGISPEKGDNPFAHPYP